MRKRGNRVEEREELRERGKDEERSAADRRQD